MYAKKWLFVSMVLALTLSFVAQNYLFTANGEAIQPQIVEAFKNGLSPKKPTSSTPSTNFPLFPTGSLIIGPSTVIQPTQIIYPNAVPTPQPGLTIYIEHPTTSVPLPTVIYNTPTPRPLPTAYVPPTNPPQPTSLPQNTNTNMDDWGECLKRAGMTLYYITTCSVCGQQKNLLGAAFKHIESINCNQNPTVCTAAGVRSVPSWGQNGVVVIPGGTTLDYIAEISNCQLPN